MTIASASARAGKTSVEIDNSLVNRSGNCTPDSKLTVAAPIFGAVAFRPRNASIVATPSASLVK